MTIEVVVDVTFGDGDITWAPITDQEILAAIRKEALYRKKVIEDLGKLVNKGDPEWNG